MTVGKVAKQTKGERTHPKTVKTWNFPAYPNILDSSPFFCFSISKAPFVVIDGLVTSNPSIIIKSFSYFCHSIQSISIQSDTQLIDTSDRNIIEEDFPVMRMFLHDLHQQNAEPDYKS